VIDQEKCSAGLVKAYCCDVDAWDRVLKDIYILIWHGEPLPAVVARVAKAYQVDPHHLDFHVEGVHGWEPHDVNYGQRVEQAAACMLRAGYGGAHENEELCG
jgi:hypothetical protein